MAALTYRAEAWSIPGVGPFTKLLGTIPIIDADLSEPDDDYGYGTISIPTGWIGLSVLNHADPVTPANNATALIVLYPDGADDDDPAFEFFATFADRAITDDGQRAIRVHGPGIGDRLNEAIVYPYSDTFSDWIWGGRELLTNPNFEAGVEPTAYEIFHDHTGGDYTLAVTPEGAGTDVTPAIAWDADAAALEAALLTTAITALSVVGDGTEDSPFEISISGPQGPIQLIINTNNLTGGTNLSVDSHLQGGITSVEPWTKSTNPDTGQLHGQYATDGFRLTTDAEAGIVIEGTRSLWINGLTQFAGAQQSVGGVKPGTPLTAGVSVRMPNPDPNNRFRLVLRDLNEQLLDTTPETVLPLDSNVHRVTLANTQLTDTSAGVIWRFAHTNPTNPFPFVIDEASLREGLPPTTAGDIGLTLIAHAQARGRLLWLEPTWTTALDSGGVVWDEDELELSFSRGMKYGHHVWGKLAQMGYEWVITRKPGAAAGAVVTHQIHMWNPEGRGVVHPRIAVVAGAGVIDGSAPTRGPRFTALLAEGPGNKFAEATDADLAAVYGVIEEYLPEQQALTEGTLAREAGIAITREKANLLGYQALIDRDTGLVNVGDTIRWTFPESADSHLRRVSAIRRRARTRDNELVWLTELTASRVRTPEAAKSRAIRDMLTAYKRLLPEQEPFPIPRGGGGGIPDVVIAPFDCAFPDTADIFCDGTPAGDLAAIREAVALIADGAAGWIHFLSGHVEPNGGCFIGGPSELKFTGAGLGVTTITLAAGSAVEALFWHGGTTEPPNTIQRLIWQDITLDGNKAGGTTVLRGLLASSFASEIDYHLERVELRNSPSTGLGASGAVGRSANKWRLVDCEIHDNTGVGANLQGSDSRITSTEIVNNGGDGLGIDFGGTHLVVGSNISFNGGDGIDGVSLTGRAKLTVVGSNIEGNAGHGIANGNLADPITVVGNYIINNGGTSVVAHPDSEIGHNVIYGNGTDQPSPVSDRTPQAVTFSKTGVLAAGTVGTLKFVAPRSGIIVSVQAAVGSSPTGAALIVDVDKNAVTIFTTQANRPTIADGASISPDATPDITAIADGDYFTVNVEQIGSTDPGSDLTVTINLEWD